MWDVAAAKPLRDLLGHESEVSAVALDVPRGLAVTGGADSTVRLWELTTGQCVRVFRGHDGWVRSVALTRCVSGSVLALAVSRDGRRAAAGTHDRKVLAWKLERPA